MTMNLIAKHFADKAHQQTHHLNQLEADGLTKSLAAEATRLSIAINIFWATFFGYRQPPLD